MSNTFDVIVVGTGPGGYETAIRATQLGFKTAVVEKNKLGGVCLNVGCIPTKALLKSAELVSYANNLSSYGLELEGTVRADFPKVIERSRTVAKKMNSGVQYLMKKNNIEVIFGHAKLTGSGALSVSPSVDMDGKKVGRTRKLKAKHIILATGARAREIPPLPIDGEKIIDYKGAMLQETRPARLLIAGAGAIGVEFAYFYHHMGTEVHLVELQNRIVPIEDEDVSKQLARSFKKAGIKVSTGATVERVEPVPESSGMEPRLDLSALVPEADDRWPLRRTVGPLLVAVGQSSPLRQRRLWAMRDPIGASGFELVEDASEYGRVVSAMVG